MEQVQAVAPVIDAEQAEALAEVSRPLAWVGCREDYEGEQRYGAWVDVTQRPREVMSEIKAIVNRTPDGLGKRWDFCELRGFGGWRPDEHEGLPIVVQVAHGVVAYGEHYGGLASVLGPDSPALTQERYELSYLGSWPSVRAFAEQVISDSGWHEALTRLPRSMQPYIRFDTNRLIREAGRELKFVRHPEGVWVYDPRVW